MTKKNKLQKIFGTLQTFEGEISGIYKSLDEEMQKVSKALKESITAKTLGQVNQEFKKLEGKFRPLLSAFEDLKGKLAERDEDIKGNIRASIEKLTSEWNVLMYKDEVRALRVAQDLVGLRAGLEEVSSRKIPDFASQIKEVEASLRNVMATWNTNDLEDRVDINKVKLEEDLKDLEVKLDKTRTELISLFSNKGGGNANRNIAVGGNTSVLGRYTDLNIKPGSNVTLTYSSNNTTKYTDLTIAATGGAGTSRSISTVAVSSVLADTAATDIVVLANGGIQLTLPTAVSNTNLYTIKNIGSSSVLVGTTGGETIDTESNLIMPVQYTAVDLISDNTNWHIT